MLSTIRSLLTAQQGRLAYLLAIVVIWIVCYASGVGPPWSYLPLLGVFLPILWHGIMHLIHREISAEFFLIIAACIGVIGGETTAITVVLFIMLLAEFAEDLIKERTSSALESLIKLIPQDARIKRGDEEVIVPVEQVQPGMLLVIKTGERIAVDGIVVQGEASVQEAFITGESIPVQKAEGQIVFAGTFLEASSIIIQAQKVGEATYLGKIKELLKQAEQTKAKVVLLADRITTFFTPVFLVGIAVVWFYTGDVRLIVTLLVFGSPLELALVTPLTLLAGTAAAFKTGVLIKNSSSLEHLAATDVMIFDKTGTLTIGSPEIVSIKSLDPQYSETDVLFLAAVAEKRSGHILAKGILKKAHETGLSIPDPEKYTSITGHGITITYQGKTYMVGNRHFIEAKEHGNLPLGECQEVASYTTFYVASAEKVIGQICLTDTIRHDARQVLDDLKVRGITNLILLSGDKQEVARSVAEQLGIPTYFGQVMPDEKLTLIRNLQEQGHRVTMVGDGINDAPALKQATVGIAIGSMGMEPAIAAADIVLMSDNIQQIVFLYDLSTKTMRIVKQNLIFGFAFTHLVGIILTFMLLLSPIQAALLHAITDILILLNSVRLTWFAPKSM